MPLSLAELWDFSDPAASERRFAAAVEHEDARTSESLRAEVLTQLARAQGLQRRFDEARATLDRAQALAADVDSRAAVRVLLERGRVTNTSGDPKASVPQFESAWAMARRLGEDTLAVDAAHMLGIVAPGEAGMEWNLQAMRIAESSGDPAANKWTASLRNNIGWWLHDRGRFAEALAMFEAARAERERMGARGPLLIARWSVARCLRSLGRIDDALAMQNDLAAAHQHDGSRDGFVHEEIGECLLALGRAAEARPHFARAHALLSMDAGLCASAPERIARLAANSQGR